MRTPRDLALAYSPGVAGPYLAIAARPDDVYGYTGKGNLVAVISNGSAVLGLGNLGPAASKPIMEGKAVLFKKFAGLDCFDLELDATDPDEFIRVVKALAPNQRSNKAVRRARTGPIGQGTGANPPAATAPRINLNKT